MYRPDPRTGEHCDCTLNTHRHINGNAFAFSNAQRFQAIGHADDIGLQFGIANAARILGRIVGFKNERDRIAKAPCNMTVHRIMAQV